MSLQTHFDTRRTAPVKLAATVRGLATAPMSGFDAGRMREVIGLTGNVRPVMLLAVGRALPQGNGPQKPRRPLADVLTLL